MIGDNRIIIAAAGSGKTTYLIEQAMKVTDARVLITTYTESNEAEIRQKFFEMVGRVPAHVTIMTWFSFLITHGVKPFQGCTFDFDVAGMVFAVTQSGIKTVVNGQPIPYPESDFQRHFFDRVGRVFSDKLPKLMIRCNDNSGGSVIDRIARIFPHVFVDEVQDLAGYDLEIIAALARSPARLLIGVGTQNGPRYTLRFCRAFDGAHLAKRSERGGWRIGIGPEVIAGEIDMLPTER